MASVLTPPILDSTGSEIVEKLQTLKQNIHASSADKEIIYNGVYPDYSNLIHSFTIPDGGGYVGWTATQECFAVISNAYTGLGNLMNIKINDVAVVTCYTDMTNVSSALLGHFASFYLKKGDVFEVSIPTNMAGADSSAKFYGLRKGTIEREITVDGLLAPTPAIYSSDEQQVGIWTDGKPLYQKTVHINSLPSTAYTDTNYPHGIANIDTICDWEGIGRWSSGNTCKFNHVSNSEYYSGGANLRATVDTTNITVFVGTDRSSMNADFTIQYTKTTDTAWESGGFKAYGFTPVIYSETEREIGVWSDGKPLYEKTIKSTITPSANAWNQIALPENISVKTYCGYYRRSTGAVNKLSAYREDSNPAEMLFDSITNSTYYYRISSAFIANFTEIDLVIQYTKTTDIAGSGKYTTIGIPAVHYSTDEQIIGTWIDGKTLYQKTVYVASLTNDGSFHAISNAFCANIDKVISLEGTVDRDLASYGMTGDITYQINSEEMSSYVNFVRYDKYTNELRYKFKFDTNAVKNLIVTSQYTKTS